MAISYPLTIPTTPKFTSVEFTLAVQGTGSVTVFSGKRKIQNYSRRFEFTASLPAMEDEAARVWLGFFAALDGAGGTFTAGDPDYAGPYGVATGTPLVDGAHTTRARTLETKGWTSSTADILKAGDYIQLGDYMYMVALDVTSDSSGDATLEIFPELRTDVSDNTAITTASPTTIFRMGSPNQSWLADSNGVYTLQFAAIEDLP
jgi:hypothetical protein